MTNHAFHQQNKRLDLTNILRIYEDRYLYHLIEKCYRELLAHGFVYDYFICKQKMHTCTIIPSFIKGLSTLASFELTVLDLDEDKFIS